MRATASLLAFVLCAFVPTIAAAQDGEEEPEGIDVGMDEEPPPEDEPPPEEDPDDEMVIRDPKTAKKLAEGAAKIVKAGDKLLKKKKVDQANAEYARAIPAYQRSFELNPDAKILVIIAGLEERLQLWFEARGHYVQAMAETELPLDDKSRAKAQAGVDSASQYLGVVTLVIQPEGAMILLDGAELGVAPLTEPLVLKPGEYTLAVSADGYLPLETKLVVDAGSESERGFELEAEPERVYVPPPQIDEPEPEPLPAAPSKLVLMIGAGTTLAFTIGAITTGVIALGKHGTFTDPGASEQDKTDAQSSGPTMAVLTDVFTTAALLAAGATAYYYLKIYTPKVEDHDRQLEERNSAPDEVADRSQRPRRAPRAPKVVVAPTVQEGGGGLVVAGWF